MTTAPARDRVAGVDARAPVLGVDDGRVASTAPSEEEMMRAPPPRPYWSPYVAGIGLGLVLLVTFVLTGLHVEEKADLLKEVFGR